MEKIVLVDKNDKEIGAEKKLKAHIEGKLHRAFTIFIFNPKGELLLQRRAKTKYHCGGRWSNTCCSHPRPGERLEESIHRRLKEEMGFDCKLKEIFNFRYKVKLDNNLSENEYNHVFVGNFDGSPNLNSEDASELKWVKLRN